MHHNWESFLINLSFLAYCCQSVAVLLQLFLHLFHVDYHHNILTEQSSDYQYLLWHILTFLFINLLHQLSNQSDSIFWNYIKIFNDYLSCKTYQNFTNWEKFCCCCHNSELKSYCIHVCSHKSCCLLLLLADHDFDHIDELSNMSIICNNIYYLQRLWHFQFKFLSKLIIELSIL